MNVSASGTLPLAYQWRLYGTNVVNGGNISGATLSCRHVTDGVKRLLVLHDFVLKNR